MVGGGIFATPRENTGTKKSQWNRVKWKLQILSYEGVENDPFTLKIDRMSKLEDSTDFFRW